MRVLLTGAGGFVGDALLRRLVADGQQVVAVQGTREPTQTGPGINWRRLDLLRASESDIAALVDAEGVSHCVHAAWYTNHADYLDAEVNRAWLAASLRLADGFHAGGGRRFVGLGTCLEYDQQSDGGRFSETDTPLRPDTLYARCKAELFERLSEMWMAGAGEGAWARIFFVYGPGDRDNRLIPYVLGNLSRGVAVSARHGGLLRDYIHVIDLAAQLAKIIVGGVRGAINTGTGEAVKIADIFRIAGDLYGRPDLVHVNDDVGDGGNRRIEADMSRFRRSMGSLEVRPIQQGLRDLVGIGGTPVTGNTPAEARATSASHSEKNSSLKERNS